METMPMMPGGRVPPNHPESERGVLGAMMRSAEAVMLAQETLKEEDFYDPAHREIFSAMQRERNIWKWLVTTPTVAVFSPIFGRPKRKFSAVLVDASSMMTRSGATPRSTSHSFMQSASVISSPGP